MTRAAALRVGWCPGALRPMASGDGLIVRVKPRGGALSCDAAQRLAAAAARYGTGVLDLTTRANLQIRGVTEESLDGLTRALDALGLLDADAGAESRRNVIASPLAGLDPAAAFDIRPAVAALERALAAAGDLALPGKFGFAVSDGGTMPLRGVSADVSFDAVSEGRFVVRLDGDPRTAVTCVAGAMPALALRLAAVFVAARRRDPDVRRMRDLVRIAGAGEVLRRADPAAPRSATLSAGEEGVEPSPVRCSMPRCVGRIDVGGKVVLGVAAAFGRLDASQLVGLARGAADAGAREIRLTPWRAVLVPGLVPDAAESLAEACVAVGLIVDPADPRLRVAACAGAPGCRRGTTPVLDHAARWAPLLGPGDATDGIALHVSGCAKGCAHPGPAPLTLVAQHGLYAMVAEENAAAPPAATGLAAEDVPRLLETLLRRNRLA